MTKSGIDFVERRKVLYCSCFEVLSAAGFDLSSESIADALWLSPILSGLTWAAADQEDRSGEDGAELQDLEIDEREGAEDVTNVDFTLTGEPSQTKIDQRNIYPNVPGASGPSKSPVSSIRNPGGAALPNTLAIGRALRPFLKYRDSRFQSVIDEEATVDQTALAGRLTLVFRPLRERLLDLTLVVEETPSMEVWRQTVLELEGVLERRGAFRDVRRWRLRLDPEPRLLDRSGSIVPSASLNDPTGNRLILVLTQGTHTCWKDKEIRNWLWAWGSHQPTRFFNFFRNGCGRTLCSEIPLHNVKPISRQFPTRNWRQFFLRGTTRTIPGP